MSLFGKLVRVRTDLTTEEKRTSPVVSSSMEKYLGRIGIVYSNDTAGVVTLFFDNEPHWAYWARTWIIVLSDDDVAKQDASWLAGLRAAFDKKFPITTRRKLTIGDRVRVRTDIPLGEEIRGTKFTDKKKKYEGKSGVITSKFPDGDVRITFSGLLQEAAWWWHPSWLIADPDADGSTTTSKKRSLDALKAVEQDLEKIVRGVAETMKKIKV